MNYGEAESRPGRVLGTGVTKKAGGIGRGDLLAMLAFAAGVAVLCFGAGFVIGREWIFPYQLLAPAVDAAIALGPVLTPEELFKEDRYGKKGAVVHDRAAVSPGVTLITGYTPEGFEGWLVDIDGKVLHRWKARFSQVFPEAPQLLWQGSDDTFVWHGTHLYPNGDLLLNMQDGGFPTGAGLVKLDKDSRVIWALPRNTHHDLDVAPDGTIWVAAQRYRRDPHPGMRNMAFGFYEDMILAVSPDGKVEREISLLDALAATYPGLLRISYYDNDWIESDDPTHLNNVEVLTPAMAAHFPIFKAGDLLVSMRHIHTIAVIDPATGKTKWALTGPFLDQHDPDFAPDGTILVLDNRGGRSECGRSRVLKIDPVTQAVRWRYEGCGGTPFFTVNRGTVQQLANGDVLIDEALGGRVLEVTGGDKPRIVWEYFNQIEIDGKPKVGLINHAERFAPGELTFLNAPGS